MEYLVTMTTSVPDGTPEEAVDDMRTREAARSKELAAQGHLLRLWRPPLQPGEWRSLGLFAAEDRDQLEGVLASMPLRVWRTDEVLPLRPTRMTRHSLAEHDAAAPTCEEFMSPTHEKVVIVTGGSQGIGAGIVAAYRQQGWAAVAIARTIKPIEDDDILTIEADITEPSAADRIVSETLEKFGQSRYAGEQRWALHRQAVHRIHPRGLPVRRRRESHGFLLADSESDRRDAQVRWRSRGKRHDNPRRQRRFQFTIGAYVPHQRGCGSGDEVTGDRVCVARHPGERCLTRMIRTPSTMLRNTKAWVVVSPWATWARSAISSRASCFSNRRPSSPERSCTSTVARSPVTDLTLTRMRTP